ncbi:MAG: cysteine--tRNA ligase [Eubacteriales bacterium]|nr:cysteine--tRNA ligase [Eubacteriales bacterium]
MKIYNTQTRSKEELQTIEPGKVKMYVCGPTVYNYFHLGNARPFITYDTFRRFLEYRGYDVAYVQNFTDIDDKMIKKANEEGITVGQLADRYIAEYFRDADGLNIRRATVHPRATDSIDEMQKIIATLMDKGYAYQLEDGVYYDVAKFENYGQLSHHNLEDLEAGASDRVSSDQGKHNPMDFALWKLKKPNEPFWPSPWGEGRPGWHIECSAMIREHLGVTIDIHGGGQDLVFPHHENEIAQSEAANDAPFVHYWLHNGFINVDQEKMSKSAGNFFTVRDLVEHFEYDVLRFFMLTGHYRMPINFSGDLLTAAQNGWTRIKTCVENLDFVAASDRTMASNPNARADAAQTSLAEQAATLVADCTTARASFIAAMEDDLNTADALAAIFDLVRAANTAATVTDIAPDALQTAAATLRELLDVLGLNPTREAQIPAEVLALVDERGAAKKARDFARADALRNQVLELGYEIKDTPQGPKVSAR